MTLLSILVYFIAAGVAVAVLCALVGSVARWFAGRAARILVTTGAVVRDAAAREQQRRRRSAQGFRPCQPGVVPVDSRRGAP